MTSIPSIDSRSGICALTRQPRGMNREFIPFGKYGTGATTRRSTPSIRDNASARCLTKTQKFGSALLGHKDVKTRIFIKTRSRGRRSERVGEWEKKFSLQI